MKTSFMLPPRFFPLTLRCALQDDSLTRLREMQRIVQARRTDLRARGVRGKAEEEDTRLESFFDDGLEQGPLETPRRKDSKRGRPRKIVEAPNAVTDSPRAVRQTPKANVADAVEHPARGRIIHRTDGNLPFCRRDQSLGFTIRECQLGAITDFTKDTFTREDVTLPWKRLFNAQKRSEVTETDGVVDLHAAEADILGALNEAQRRAVLVDPSLPCLVLAGPGSGKTRVLTHRIAYLVKKYQVSPYKILAMTFTNKAATEMKERVVSLLFDDVDEEGGKQVTRKLAVGTFHSISARLLRKYGGEIGIPREFDICDTSDSRAVLTKVMRKTERVDAVDAGTVRMTNKMISKIKNISDEEKKAMKPYTFRRFSELRVMYDQALRSMKLLDYDDLLLETRRLLQECPYVLEELQNRFDNVLVDEWQDTNHVQFDIVSLLAGKRGNLFVVGDADQSIYKFRGADSANMQRFCETYPNSLEITLDRNYRSSGCIIEAAQSVINEDKKRPVKQMTTTNDLGTKVVLQQTSDGKHEAKFVVSQLKRLSTSGELQRYSDAAVMYRTNAQSRQLEEAFLYSNIPYKLQSGVRFYERAEIKDIMGYIKLIANPDDDNSFRRIVNTPPRGMGKKALEVMEKFAEEKNISLSVAVTRMIAACQDSGETFSLRPQMLRHLASFYNLLYSLRKNARHLSPEGAAALEANAQSSNPQLRHVGDLVTFVVGEIGYRGFLDNRKDDEQGSAEKKLQRQANVDELIQSASRYDDVRQFLENVALLSNTDHENQNSGHGAVSLMTLHSGKGLEFKAVFIVGVEDGVIPIMRKDSYEDTIDEERRLLYVGMTRAKSFLYMTWRIAKLMITKTGVVKDPNGSTPSRFLKAIPKDFSVRMTTGRRRPH